MAFYTQFSDFNPDLDINEKKERIIKIRNFPIPPEKIEKKNPEKEVDLIPIPAPVPEEEYTMAPPIYFYIEKNDLASSDQYYTWGGEFKPPDYDDIMIGVLGRNVKEGTRIYEPEIIYPEVDKRAYIKGQIILKMTINPKGKVISAYVLNSIGNTAIENAAKDAAMKCLYKPVTKKGKPVYFQDNWTINFNLK